MISQGKAVGGQGGALWDVLPVFKKLCQHLKNRQDKTIDRPEVFTDHYINSVNAAFVKMRQYYTLTDETRLYRMAVALHPEYRSTWFTENWSNLADGADEINNANTTIKDCWNDYLASRDARQAAASSYLTSVFLPTPSTTSADSTANTAFTTPRTAYTKAFYDLMGIRRKERDEVSILASRERERLRTSGELERYPQAELNLNGYYGQPLRWWQELGSKEHPTLASLAFTVFAIPAMSAECERAFSRAGKMVTDDRYQLKADIIEADQLIKSWLAGGLIDRNKAWRVLDEIQQQQLLESHQQRPVRLQSSAGTSEVISELI